MRHGHCAGWCADCDGCKRRRTYIACGGCVCARRDGVCVIGYTAGISITMRKPKDTDWQAHILHARDVSERIYCGHKNTRCGNRRTRTGKHISCMRGMCPCEYTAETEGHGLAGTYSACGGCVRAWRENMLRSTVGIKQHECIFCMKGMCLCAAWEYTAGIKALRTENICGTAI